MTTRESADQRQQLTSWDHDNSHESSPEHCTCHVKLPKLFIKRFGGDLTKCTTFWAEPDTICAGAYYF